MVNPELVVAVEHALLEWGRLSVVSDAEDADLLLQLAPTADVSLLSGKGAKAVAIITDNSGMKLWSSVKGGDWSLSGLSYPKVGKGFHRRPA